MKEKLIEPWNLNREFRAKDEAILMYFDKFGHLKFFFILKVFEHFKTLLFSLFELSS